MKIYQVHDGVMHEAEMPDGVLLLEVGSTINPDGGPDLQPIEIINYDRGWFRRNDDDWQPFPPITCEMTDLTFRPVAGGASASQPPPPTVLEVLDRVCAEAARAAEQRLKLDIRVRVHPATFRAIADVMKAKIDLVDGLETIALYTAAGRVPMTPDPDVPEGHPCFDQDPTP